ncbi:MAG: patatin-like phospholipase family protein [Planctomycetota bacterium]
MMTDGPPKKTSFKDVYLEELKWIKTRRRELRKKWKPTNADKVAVAETKAAAAKLDSNIPNEKSADPLHELQTQALDADLCGLAISGGGIRSATYSLGVLQGLAALRLLPRFDYLSTVSGGGYIGAWFSAWVNRDGFDNVEEKLLPPRLRKNPTPEVEAEPIQHLRLYSNYLAPRPGLFSFDGWVLIAIYLRNLLLNQLVLLMAVLGLFVGVRTIVEFFSISHGPQAGDGLQTFVFVAALCMLVVALVGVLVGAAVFAPKGCLRSVWKFDFTLSRFWLACVVPWLLAASVGSLLIASPMVVARVQEGTPGWLIAAMMFGFLHGLLGYLSLSCPKHARLMGALTGFFGGVVFFLLWKLLLLAATGQTPSHDVTVAAVVTFGVPLSLCSYVLTNFLMIGLCGHCLSELEREWWSSVNSRLMMLATAWAALFGTAVFGPYLLGQIWLKSHDWYLLVTGTAGAAWLSALFAGLKAAQGPDTKSTTRGGIKESLARAAPALFLITLFLGLATITTWLTYDIFAGLHKQGSWEFGDRLPMLLTDLNSPKTSISLGFKLPVSLALLTAVGCFIGFLLPWGAAVGVNMFSLQNLRSNPLVRCYLGASKRNRNAMLITLFLGIAYITIWLTYGELPVHWALLMASGLLIGLSRLLGGAVGINTFSLQNLYANRLVRCYLGASKYNRKPNPVVNMDLNDDCTMSMLFPGPESKSGRANADKETKKKWGPIHIINGALNQKASAVRSKGDQRPSPNGTAQTVDAGAAVVETTDEQRFNPDATRQEYRAESLQFLERQAESFVFTPLYCGSEATGYCRSDEFAGDVKLGTAVAVSGAAVSPNMGYHSSPAITALLTVFNVRLGAWFGNPSRASRTEKNPAASGGLLLSELAGMTDASDYIYVSDGGHFENMGVYELIRRRCRFIVAVDAGEDPKFHENVGRVVRQVRIDFGIWIEVDMAPVTPGTNGLCASHLVVGRIHYGDVHRPKQKPPNQQNDLREQDPRDPNYSREQNHGIIIWIKNSLTGDEPGDLVNHAAMHPRFPYDLTLDQFFSEPQFESYRALGIHSVLKSLILPGDKPAQQASATCTGSAPVELPTRDAWKRVRTCSTTDIFKHIYEFWLTKPAQYVTGYVQENEAYAKIQTALREDEKLRWLAKELYGTKKDKDEASEPTNADRTSCGMAERLMTNEMFTLLENVFLQLDLERHYLHPVHAGWMGVFENWVASSTFNKHWNDPDGKTGGLHHEYCPAFVRFVDLVRKKVDEEKKVGG